MSVVERGQFTPMAFSSSECSSTCAGASAKRIRPSSTTTSISAYWDNSAIFCSTTTTVAPCSRVDAIVEEFAFDPDDDPFLLNRGARQLLALASIVVLAPPVVVLDEPTTGLDYRECVKVMDIIRRIHERGTTVVMVCHDMEVVADYAARCIVMSGGEVVDDAPTFDVLRNRETLERASLVPPQIVELSLELGREMPHLADGPVGRANTLDEMAAAVMEEVRTSERSVCA